jgi:DNA-binding transcriptional LysR family regulator
MNLEQLEAINAVVEKGSFRAAAEHLHRSQPALSATIKNLEEEFDILLFDRTEYRPKLTEAGAAFLHVARVTLDAAHYAARVAFELGRNKAETKLHVSVDPLISIKIIETLAHTCAQSILPVNLVMDKSILKSCYQDLLDGKIDLAFAPYSHAVEKIEKITLETVTLVGAISKKLLREENHASASLLSKCPQILVYDKRFDEPPDELLPNPHYKYPGHKIFVPDHFTKLRLIQGGIGWGRISRMELEKSEFLVPIDNSLCEIITLELCILRAKQRPIGPIAQTIWKAFQEQNYFHPLKVN